MGGSPGPLSQRFSVQHCMGQVVKIGASFSEPELQDEKFTTSINCLISDPALYTAAVAHADG